MKTMRRYDLALLALSVVTYLIFSFLIDERVISSFWRLQIVLMCINVILAASLNLINGITGQFSLGHAGFMAVGAYVSAVMTMWYDLPFGLALLIGGLAAAFIGIIIGIPTLRLDGDYLAIATLGMGEIIRITILNIPAVGGASGLTGIPRLTDFTWVFVAMIITLFFIKNMVNSTFGRSCISVRENAIAATAMGINTTSAQVLAFAVG
ncbi:MAG TPA: branched-chain amino acid ABC transporter permease, partial [Veillonellaceae bacterium]|nr:branched-chain amino acid ABC transporter permease [Veillonellaceae bacterium]